VEVIVTGGRNYGGRSNVYETLDHMHSQTPITLIIQGGALGADCFALEWAVSRKVPHKTYHAEWNKYGKSAGTKRNRLMLFENQSATVTAFPGGTGTKNCVDTAKQLNMKVIIIKDNV